MKIEIKKQIKEEYDFFKKHIRLPFITILWIMSTTTTTLIILPIDTSKSMLIFLGISLPLIVFYIIFYFYKSHKYRN